MTPTQIGGPLPEHESVLDAFSRMPTTNFDRFDTILERQAQEAREQANEREARLQRWMIDFQADADRREAQRQAETRELLKEFREAMAQHREDMGKATQSIKDDVARLTSRSAGATATQQV
jgi:lysyl-tRNA synthetase class I